MKEEVWKIHLMFFKEIHHYLNVVEKHASKSTFTSNKFLIQVQGANFSI